MFRRSLILLGCVVALAAAGCGSKSSSSATVAPATSTPAVHFAKTKFVFHAGLAFGAFHHFIYEPIKAGDLKHPLLHKLTIVKMGLAGLFVYHELKLAAQDVRASKVLSTLFAPLTALADKIKTLATSHATSSNADSVNSDVASLSSAAASKGQSITESLPSTTQLASGVAP